MTVEEIYQDRTKFNEAVFNVASRDLANMGIAVISFTLQSIEDDVKYVQTSTIASLAALCPRPSALLLMPAASAQRHHCFASPSVTALFSRRYLSSLGAPSTAEVQRNAKIGRAEAARDSGTQVWPHPGVKEKGKKRKDSP